MKKTFTLYLITTKTVCVPNEDYYARGNDWYEGDIQMLQEIESFDTEELAINYIQELKADNKYSYTILPTYTV